MIPEKPKFKRGGARLGAGRKKGSSVYGETTQAIRVPESMITEVKSMLSLRKQLFKELTSQTSTILFPSTSPTHVNIPLFTDKVAAGFPSLAEDHVEKTLDINELLIEHPAATFFVRVTGDSMIGASIQDGDILVVDRSIKPADGKIVIALVNGEYTVKRLSINGNIIKLCPENPNYVPIDLSGMDELIVWGVVTGLARQF